MVLLHVDSEGTGAGMDVVLLHIAGAGAGVDVVLLHTAGAGAGVDAVLLHTDSEGAEADRDVELSHGRIIFWVPENTQNQYTLRVLAERVLNLCTSIQHILRIHEFQSEQI